MNDIRLLSSSEVPLLLPGARAFFAEGNLIGELNEAHFVDSLQAYIDKGIGFVLVAGNPPFRGAIAGAIFPDFASGVPRCMEFFWYVNQQERGFIGVRLLKEFENEAKKRGADNVLMMHLVAGKQDQFSAFFERCGYKLREQVFAKKLN